MPKRRPTRRKPAAPKPTADLGTPETAAKLQPPPWSAWPDPHRYASAATEIRLAWCILCAGLLAKAQDLTRVNGIILSDSDGQHAAVTRYRRWLDRLRPARNLGIVIDLVVDGRHGGIAERDICRDALGLYLALFPSPLDRHPESA